MPPSDWKKIEEIFEQAVELPKAEREDFLVKMCDGNDELRREVEDLLAADEDAVDFIESPVISENTLSQFMPDTIEDSVAPNSIGRRIGSYQLIRELGRGGMGAVFLANRADDEYRKLVAIKIIKRGMDSDFIVKRFRNERQILATLDHPNIARLLDGGTTEDGLPYFVMEYIEGEPIHFYCDLNRLSLRERLKLFQKVCSAVHYAHQNLVIHRDLKPGNILVTKDGNLKLLDFGIAKLLNPELAADTLAPTLTGMRLMTPEYASPEQIKGERLTPASDIYSLGVLLYEILTGKRPYRFPSRAPHDIARVICEDDPENPAKVLTSQNDSAASKSNDEPQTLETLSRNRQTTPENLQQELSGNLQNILLKALRKSPHNRYETVIEFSKDIESYLEGKPISAPTLFHETDEPRFEHSISSNESLAVLPFRTLILRQNKEPDTGDYLSVGLADSLIIRLSNLKHISVRPTSAVLRYAQSDSLSPEMAGRELNVTYVLEGRIQQVGKRVRVTAQLIRVQNNETVWAGQFDEKSDDILTLQDSISGQVAEALVHTLTGEERRQIEKRGTNNVKAYESYLKGRYHWHTYTVEGLAKALVCFYEAIALDPNFAGAYSGIADYYNFLSVFGIMSPKDSFPAAKEAALKAIELDPNLAEAYVSLAVTNFGYDWDFAEAERNLKKSIKLNPNYSESHMWYAQTLSLTGRHELALKEIARAESLNPQSPSLLITSALTHRNARKFDKALEKIHRAMTIQPNYYLAAQAYGWVVKFLKNYDEAEKICKQAVDLTERLNLPLYAYGYVLAIIGKKEKAQAIAKELEPRRENQYVPPIYIALIYVGLGENNLAFEWLEKAFEERDFWAAWINVDPRFDDLKKDARFDEFVKKIKPLTVEKIDDAIHQSHIATKILPEKTTDESIKIENTQEVKISNPKRNYKKWAIATAAVLALIFIGNRLGFIGIEFKKTSTPTATPNISTNSKQKAIAILPFKTDSHTENEESLGVGLAESLYKKLGQVKELSVRPAMLNLSREQSPKELGTSFGVAYILRGTLHNTGVNIQVDAELIDTNNEKILWAERFDEPIKDFPSLQIAISERVLNALTVQLTANERNRIKKSYTENSEAYQLYLVGRYQMANRSADNLNKAIATFSKARDLDPNFVLAYVGLADAYALLNLYQIPPPSDAYDKARENARKALELDENLAEAHASLAYVLFFNARNRAEAETHFRKAIELNPSYSTAHHWFALALAAMGKREESIEQIKLAMELEPRSAIIKTAAGLVYYYARQYEEALAVSRKSLEIDTGMVPAHKTMRVIYEAMGTYQEAEVAYQKERSFRGNTDENEPGWAMITAQVQAVGGKRDEALKSLQKALDSTVVTDNPKGFAFEIAVAYSLLDEKEKAIDWLEKAESAKDHSFNFMLVDPRLDKLRENPRYLELAKKLQK